MSEAMQVLVEEDSTGLVGRVERVLRQATTGSPLPPVVSMSVMLANLCRNAQCEFVLHNEPLPARQVMSEEMYLPLIAWKVQEQGRRLLDADLGCVLRLDAKALYGAVACVPPVTGHIVDIVRAMFFVHYAVRLFGIAKNGLIEVEPLYKTSHQSFTSMLRSQQISPEGEVQWQQNKAPSLQP